SSPGATAVSCLSNIDRRQTSRTPDSIRRSIENTGIFRDTGIRISPDSRCPGIEPSTTLDRGRQKQDSTDVFENTETGVKTSVTATSAETTRKKASRSYAISPFSGSQNRDPDLSALPPDRNAERRAGYEKLQN